jgi:hypothetical protein
MAIYIRLFKSIYSHLQNWLRPVSHKNNYKDFSHFCANTRAYLSLLILIKAGQASRLKFSTQYFSSTQSINMGGNSQSRPHKRLLSLPINFHRLLTYKPARVPGPRPKLHQRLFSPLSFALRP